MGQRPDDLQVDADALLPSDKFLMVPQLQASVRLGRFLERDFFPDPVFTNLEDGARNDSLQSFRNNRLISKFA
jgi:hypothetical protein